MRPFLLAALCLLPAMAQSPTPCTGANTPYSYFGLTSISYNYFDKSPAIGTGFGLKAGTCSTIFLLTVVNTGIGPSASTTGYATLNERLEYHIIQSGNWEFIGDGQVGVMQITSQSGQATAAMFGGGVGVGYDVGWAISKGKFHLPLVVHADYVAVTAPGPLPSGGIPVKPSYTLDLRKTF